MAVKIVTDSTSDISKELAAELDISVVPVSLLFGEEVYRDGIDINADQFYERLLKDPNHPTTTQPTPQEFNEVYKKLSTEADGIISIHVSSKLSGTYQSAVQSAGEVKDCPIEVVDSYSVTMGLGLVVIEAAKMAKAGKSFQDILTEVKDMVANVHVLVLFDTLKYLAKGGRIGKGKALLGGMLNLKPLLTLKEGVFEPVGQVRSRKKGVEKLLRSLENAPKIKKLAVIHSTTPEEARVLADQAASVFDREQMVIARLGPVLGVHGGPGVLAVVHIDT